MGLFHAKGSVKPDKEANAGKGRMWFTDGQPTPTATRPETQDTASSGISINFAKRYLALQQEGDSAHTAHQRADEREHQSELDCSRKVTVADKPNKPEGLQPPVRHEPQRAHRLSAHLDLAVEADHIATNVRRRVDRFRAELLELYEAGETGGGPLPGAERFHRLAAEEGEEARAGQEVGASDKAVCSGVASICSSTSQQRQPQEPTQAPRLRQRQQQPPQQQQQLYLPLFVQRTPHERQVRFRQWQESQQRLRDRLREHHNPEPQGEQEPQGRLHLQRSVPQMARAAEHQSPLTPTPRVNGHRRQWGRADADRPKHGMDIRQEAPPKFALPAPNSQSQRQTAPKPSADDSSISGKELTPLYAPEGAPNSVRVRAPANRRLFVNVATELMPSLQLEDVHPALRNHERLISSPASVNSKTPTGGNKTMMKKVTLVTDGKPQPPQTPLRSSPNSGAGDSTPSTPLTVRPVKRPVTLNEDTLSFSSELEKSCSDSILKTVRSISDISHFETPPKTQHNIKRANFNANADMFAKMKMNASKTSVNETAAPDTSNETTPKASRNLITAATQKQSQPTSGKMTVDKLPRLKTSMEFGTKITPRVTTGKLPKLKTSMEFTGVENNGMGNFVTVEAGSVVRHLTEPPPLETTEETEPPSPVLATPQATDTLPTLMTYHFTDQSPVPMTPQLTEPPAALVRQRSVEQERGSREVSASLSMIGAPQAVLRGSPYTPTSPGRPMLPAFPLRSEYGQDLGYYPMASPTQIPPEETTFGASLCWKRVQHDVLTPINTSRTFSCSNCGAVSHEVNTSVGTASPTPLMGHERHVSSAYTMNLPYYPNPFDSRIDFGAFDSGSLQLRSMWFDSVDGEDDEPQKKWYHLSCLGY